MSIINVSTFDLIGETWITEVREGHVPGRFRPCSDSVLPQSRREVWLYETCPESKTEVRLLSCIFQTSLFALDFDRFSKEGGGERVEAHIVLRNVRQSARHLVVHCRVTCVPNRNSRTQIDLSMGRTWMCSFVRLLGVKGSGAAIVLIVNPMRPITESTSLEGVDAQRSILATKVNSPPVPHVPTTSHPTNHAISHSRQTVRMAKFRHQDTRW